jgi:hypothetical protein
MLINILPVGGRWIWLRLSMDTKYLLAGPVQCEARQKGLGIDLYTDN